MGVVVRPYLFPSSPSPPPLLLLPFLPPPRKEGRKASIFSPLLRPHLMSPSGKGPSPLRLRRGKRFPAAALGSCGVKSVRRNLKEKPPGLLQHPPLRPPRKKPRRDWTSGPVRGLSTGCSGRWPASANRGSGLGFFPALLWKAIGLSACLSPTGRRFCKQGGGSQWEGGEREAQPILTRGVGGRFRPSTYARRGKPVFSRVHSKAELKVFSAHVLQLFIIGRKRAP